MNIEHESGENGGNGGSSCGFIARVAVVGFPSCGRKGRLMWDSPWIRSSRQNFSKLFLIETPLTMWLWEFCICQLSTSNKSFVGLFKVAFKGSAIIVVRDNCWLEARGVAWGEVPSKESSSLCTTQAQLRAHYLILDTSPFAVQLSIGGPCKSSEVQQRK